MKEVKRKRRNFPSTTTEDGNTLSTADRKNGWEKKFLLFCSRDIMLRLKIGEENNL